MGKEISEHVYLNHDIDIAFNRGLETGLAAFDKSLGLLFDNQKLVLDKVKHMLIKDKTLIAMGKSLFIYNRTNSSPSK